MENIQSAAELKLAIQSKQVQHAIHGQLLKEKCQHAFESLKPVNVIKNTLSEISSSPYLIENMLGAAVGLISGYVSRKVAEGRSQNVFRRIMGSVLQFGVTNLVIQHPEQLKVVGHFIIEKIFHKARKS